MNVVLAPKPHPILDGYVKSSRFRDLHFDRSRKCYKLRGVTKPGLHRTLRRTFYPGFKRSKRRRTTLKKGSSKRIGSRVDKEVAAAIHGGPTRKMHRLTRALLEYFTTEQHTLEAAQVPVAIPSLQCMTQADMITSRINPITQRKELWLWELKTGFSPGLTTKPKTKPKLNTPYQRVDNTLLNHYYLQAHYTAKGFEEYAHIRFDQVRVVQVFQEGTGSKRQFKVVNRPLPSWLKQ